MNRLSICLMLLPFLLAGCGTKDPAFAEVRQAAGEKTVCITLSRNCSENKWWRHMVDKPGILREGTTADIFGETTINPDGTTEIPDLPAPGNQYIVFHGEAPGTARMVLHYADHERGMPAEQIVVYRAVVRPDLTVEMEELSRMERDCGRQGG